MKKKKPTEADRLLVQCLFEMHESIVALGERQDELEMALSRLKRKKRKVC